ncbi:MAG: hypothetical protein GY906_24695 [bacterium]|nr:hypothetical protein [bacterium]
MTEWNEETRKRLKRDVRKVSPFHGEHKTDIAAALKEIERLKPNECPDCGWPGLAGGAAACSFCAVDKAEQRIKELEEENERLQAEARQQREFKHQANTKIEAALAHLEAAVIHVHDKQISNLLWKAVEALRGEEGQ